VNAYKTGDALVTLPADEFRLPDVLKLIEAGKTVIVVPAPRDPA
jgi:hypothetical protein